MNLPKPKKINAEKYVAGLSLYKRKAVKIKLSANESALGPSPKAIKEYNKESKNLKRYLLGVRILILILALVGIVLWLFL